MANNLHFEYRLNVNEDATKKNLRAFIHKTFGNGRNTKLSVPIKLDFANSLENIDFDSIQREIDRKFKGNVKIKAGINVDTANVKAQVQRQLDRIQKDLNLKVGLEVDPKAVKALSNSADVMGTLSKEVGKLKDDMKDLGKNLAIDSDVVDKSQYQEVLETSKDIGDENRKTEKSLKEQLQTQKEILKSKEEQMKQLKKEMSSENERLQTAKERKAINDDLIQQEKELQKEVKELDKQIKAEQERQKIYESQKTSLEEQQKTQEQLTKDLKETNDELNKLQSDKKYEDGRLELARQREQISQEFIDSIHKENEALEEQLAKLEKVAEASGNVALTKAMSKRYNSPSNYTPIERTWEQEQSKARQAYLLNNKSQKIYQQIYNSDISKSIRDTSSFDIKSVEEMDAHMKELGNTLAHNRGLLAQANELLDERVELTQENINKAKELADLIINEVSQVEIARGNRQAGADKRPYKRALKAYEADPTDDNLAKLEQQAEKLAKIGAFYEYGAQGLKVLTALEDKYNVKAQKSLETQEALAENEAKRAQKHVRKTVASSEKKEASTSESGAKYRDAGDYLEAEVYGFTEEQLEEEMAKYAEKLAQSFKGKSMIDEDGFVLYDRIDKILAKNEERLDNLDEKGAQALAKRMEEIKKVINTYEKLNTVLIARESLGLTDGGGDPYAHLLGLDKKGGGETGTFSLDELKEESINYEGEAESLKKLTGQFILYCRQADVVKGQTNDLKMQFNDLSKNYEHLINTTTTSEDSWVRLAKSVAEYGDSIEVATDEMKEHIKIVESKQGVEPLTKSLEENSKARKNNAEAIKETTKALQEASKAQEQLDKASKKSLNGAMANPNNVVSDQVVALMEAKMGTYTNKDQGILASFKDSTFLNEEENPRVELVEEMKMYHKDFVKLNSIMNELVKQADELKDTSKSKKFKDLQKAYDELEKSIINDISAITGRLTSENAKPFYEGEYSNRAELKKANPDTKNWALNDDVARQEAEALKASLETNRQKLADTIRTNKQILENERATKKRMKLEEERARRAYANSYEGRLKEIENDEFGFFEIGGKTKEDAIRELNKEFGRPSAESIAKELEEMFRVVASGKGDLEQVNALYEAMKDKLKDVNRVEGGGIAGSMRDVAYVSVGVRKGVEALEAMIQAWGDAEKGSVESINKINESVKVLAENYNAIYGDKASKIYNAKGFTPTSIKTMGEIEAIRKKLEDNKTHLQLQEQNLKEAQKEAKAIEEINARLDKRLAKAQEIKTQQEEQLKLVEKASSASNGGEQLDGEGLESIRKRIETLQQEKKLKEKMASDLKGQIEQEEALGDVSDEALQRMKNRYEQLRAEAQSASNAINGITEAIRKQEKANSKMNTLSHNIVPTSNKASSSSSSSGGGGSSSASASSSQAKQESFITNELSERIKLRQRDLTLQLQNLTYGKELTANQKLMVHEMMNQIVALGSSVSSMKELNLESQKIKQNLNETKFNVKVTTTEDKDAVKKLEQQRKATEEMYKGMFDELEKQEKELLAIENMYARLFDQAELNAKVEERNKVVLEEKARLTQRNLDLKIREFEQSKLASHADQEQLQTIKNMVAEMDKNVDSAQELQSVVGKINTLYKEMQSGAKSNAEAKKLESLIATKEKDLALTHQSIANSKAYQNAIESQRVAFDQLANQLKLTGRSTEEVNKQYAQLSQQMKGMKLDMVTEQLGRQDTAFQKVLGSMKDYFVMNLDIMDCFRMVQQGFSNAFEHTKVLDEAYTNISMTMDITEKKFKTMVDTAYEVGNANGQLATEVLNMMKVYANAGTTVEEINSQMQATVAFQNVTGLDAASVTNSIQTIIQQYKLLEDGSMNAAEATEYLGDVMVGVSYNLAKEESDAMREVISGIETAGGMMKTSGASFEWFSSVIGTLAETMNASGSETANAINIFVAPYGNIGEQNSF